MRLFTRFCQRGFQCGSTKFSPYQQYLRVLRDYGKCNSAFQSLLVPQSPTHNSRIQQESFEGWETDLILDSSSFHSIHLATKILADFISPRSPQLEPANPKVSPKRGQLMKAHPGKISPNLEFQFIQLPWYPCHSVLTKVCSLSFIHSFLDAARGNIGLYPSQKQRSSDL